VAGEKSFVEKGQIRSKLEVIEATDHVRFNQLQTSMAKALDAAVIERDNW
jgi:hypothetical protein